MEQLFFVGAHQERLGSAARDMEGYELALKKLRMPARIDRRRDMTRLMRELAKRYIKRRREALCGIESDGKARHIRAIDRARPGRYAHGGNFCQVRLGAEFCQQVRQRGGVVEKGIALAQAELTLFDRQKLFAIANNLSGVCVKHSQRGCIIACVDAQCIAAHGSSDAASSAVSRPCSRATVPSRPLTNW